MKLNLNDKRDYLVWGNKGDREETYDRFIEAMKSFSFTPEDDVLIEKLADRFTYEQDDVIWCKSINKIESDDGDFHVAELLSGQVALSRHGEAIWFHNGELEAIHAMLGTMIDSNNAG